MNKNGKTEGDVKDNCVSDTAKAMPFALGAMFIRSEEQSNKHLAENMAKYIKDTFKENLSNLRWLDNESRLLLKGKIDAINVLIGKSINVYVLLSAKFKNVCPETQVKL